MIRYSVLGLLIVLISGFVLSPVFSQTEECAQNEVAYNGQISKTYRPTLDTSVDQRLCFEGQEGDSVLIEAEGIPESRPIVLALSSPSVPDLAQRSLTVDGVATIEYTLEGDGLYYIAVTAMGAQTFNYKLTLTLQPETEPSEPSDVEPETVDNHSVACKNASFILIPGYSSTFSIDDESYAHFYCFYGRAGTEYTLSATQETGSLDPLIIIFDPVSEEIVESNDDESLLKTDAKIEFTPEKTALYLVAVTRSGVKEGRTEGDFRILIENTSTGKPDVCPQIFTLPADGLEIPRGDEQGIYTFCFDGEADHVVTLTAEALRGSLDLAAHISRMDLETLHTMESSEETLTLRARMKESEPFMIILFDYSYKGGFTLFFEQD